MLPLSPSRTELSEREAVPDPGRSAFHALPLSVNGSGRTEAEVRYFLSSCSDDPAVLVAAIRRHWSIENNLHWMLDVTFREDDSRVRERTAARNLAVLRKIALNLLAADQATRTSVRGRRKKAAWNDAYMHRLIFR